MAKTKENDLVIYHDQQAIKLIKTYVLSDINFVLLGIREDEQFINVRVQLVDKASIHTQINTINDLLTTLTKACSPIGMKEIEANSIKGEKYINGNS